LKASTSQGRFEVKPAISLSFVVIDIATASGELLISAFENIRNFLAKVSQPNCIPTLKFFKNIFLLKVNF
jgi:hypothetical protein